MGKKEEFVLDIGNDAIKQVYGTHDNYEEVEFDTQLRWCLIFCSANSLYFPEIYSKFR